MKDFRFIEKVIHQQQPTYNTCVSTCLAMILQVPAQDVIDEFHGGYFDANPRKSHVSEYLSGKGIKYTLANFETCFTDEGIYLLTVPSLNNIGGTHQILRVMEDADKDAGTFYQSLLDPAQGRENKKYYIDHWIETDDELAVKFAGYSIDLFISADDYIKWMDNNKWPS